MIDTARWEEQNNAYLAAALAWLRLRLRRLGDAPAPPIEVAAPAETHWPWERRQAPALPAPTPSLDDQIAEAAQRMDEAEAAEPPPALVILGQRLELDRFERDILLLCAAMELDPAAPGLVAQAHGDAQRTYPTYGLALRLFDDPSWEALAPYRPLRHWRLLEISQPAAVPLTQSALRIDEVILDYLKGLRYVDDRLSAVISPVAVASDEQGLPPSQQATVQDVLHGLRQAPQAERAYVIQLLGPDGDSKRLVAYHAAAEAGRSLHHVAAAWLPSAVGDLETLARLWQREDQLAPVALLLDAAEVERASDTAALVDRLIRRSSGLIFLDSRDVWTGLDETVALVDVAKPTPDEQYAAWRDALGNREPCAARLAGQFNLDVSRIHRLARAAEGDTTAACDAVWRAALAGSRPRLDALAQRLDARATWDDIALPQMQEEQLRLIAGQVPHRRQVYDVWGFRDKMNRGLGISALFTGDSGTGKTMAAEVIANDLNLNLYRIDLSQVVSKYIGETEKNLRRVFDAAEDGGAILFFDEADALFGKRSEVKDSHDRYANIEINYLLQRMESYGGLAILATNMKSALDQAFLRRLRFIVSFPFPGPAERRRIWQRALPPQTPRDELDYDFLARLNLTGGSIHNAALNATFLAAQEADPDKRRVTMERILTAVRMELRKDGRAVNEAELKWTPRAAPTAPREPAVGTPS